MSAENWTAIQDDVLIRDCQINAPAFAQAKLAELGFCRSIASIKGRLRLLRAGKRGTRNKNWDSAEDNVLRAIYPTAGTRVTQIELSKIGSDRGRNAIQRRARRLGFVMGSAALFRLRTIRKKPVDENPKEEFIDPEHQQWLAEVAFRKSQRELRIRV